MDRIYNTDSCFICCELMGAFRNDLTVVTGYSERTLIQLLEEFCNISFPDEIAQEAGICQNCFIKFNEYDEYRMMAETIQSELVELFNSNDPARMQQDIKQEFEFIETTTDVYEDVYQEDTMEELFELDENNAELDENNTGELIVYDWVTEKKDLSQVSSKLEAFGGSKPKVSRLRANKSDKSLTVVQVSDNQKMYQCETCQRMFKEKSKLKSHREIHTTERNIVCPTCSKTFKTQACLRSHKRVHNPVYLYCDLCGKIYTQKPEMVKHIKFVHLHIREFFCLICGSGFGSKFLQFSSKGHLSTHMLTHADQSAKTVKCEICAAAFYTRAKLERHMKSHTKERNYECGICSKKFLYSYNVTAHIKHVHYGEKRKESEKFCSFCGKKFQKLWALQEHITQYHQVLESLKEGRYEADSS